tara:strand:- start:87 stop:218 length:132 start_codon:yes stop_codon:yes gene_type:complete
MLNILGQIAIIIISFWIGMGFAIYAHLGTTLEIDLSDDKDLQI